MYASRIFRDTIVHFQVVSRAYWINSLGTKRPLNPAPFLLKPLWGQRHISIAYVIWFMLTSSNCTLFSSPSHQFHSTIIIPTIPSSDSTAFLHNWTILLNCFYIYKMHSVLIQNANEVNRDDGISTFDFLFLKNWLICLFINAFISHLSGSTLISWPILGVPILEILPGFSMSF